MERFDLVSVGGGIVGSIDVRLAAESGLNSLLIERAKTPREKPCSGIQFGYFEKLVGRPIPGDKLCANEIVNMNIITPDEKTCHGKMKVLNFWRSTFDRWLNDLAVEEGAVFQDNAALSARFAAPAILDAERRGTTTISHYTRKMRSMTRQMKVNEKSARPN